MIDVSKLMLDAHRQATGEGTRFANTRDGHDRLLRWISETAVARIVYEPTGRYHREMERRLAGADLPLVKVNPRYARRFRKALGARAKTDRTDAAILARMGGALGLEPRLEQTESLRDLDDLLAARRALVKNRTAARSSLCRSCVGRTQPASGASKPISPPSTPPPMTPSPH